jgi:hypothetical protein
MFVVSETTLYLEPKIVVILFTRWKQKIQFPERNGFKTWFAGKSLEHREEQMRLLAACLAEGSYGSMWLPLVLQGVSRNVYSGIPNDTLWRVLRKYLQLKAYKLSIVQQGSRLTKQLRVL